MKILAIIALFISSVLASELDDTIILLGNEEFEIREKASEKLNLYPEEYAKKFLDMSNDAKDPEIRYRLRGAAKQVFARTIVSKTDEWLLLHGDLGLEFNRASSYRQEVDAENNTTNVYETIFIVNFMNSEIVGDKIKQWDVIKSIQGIDLQQSGYDTTVKAKMGVEYEVVIHRYKKTDGIENGQFDPTDKEFEEIKIKLKVGVKDERFVNPLDEMRIIDCEWKKFCEEYSNAGVPKKEGP